MLQTVFLQGLLGRNLQYLKTLNNELKSVYAIDLVPVRAQERYLLVSDSNNNKKFKMLNCHLLTERWIIITILFCKAALCKMMKELFTL